MTGRDQELDELLAPLRADTVPPADVAKWQQAVRDELERRRHEGRRPKPWRQLAAAVMVGAVAGGLLVARFSPKRGNPPPVWAADTADNAALTPRDLCLRLVVREEIYATNAEGTRVLNPGAERQHRPTLSSPPGPDGVVCSLTAESSGKPHYIQQWLVQSDGRLIARVTDPDTHIGTDAIVVKDMAPVLWTPKSKEGERVVVRLTPSLNPG